MNNGSDENEAFDREQFLLALNRDFARRRNDPAAWVDAPQPNTLGKASLILGILGSFFVFMVGLCAGVGKEQGWLKNVAPLLLIIGGSFAFLGLLSAVLGFLGLFGKGRSRAIAIAGLILGCFTVLLFLAIINAAQ